ncbi:hypothetical protein [Pseudoduganella buxea]|uniref:Uncharacterized protein n=1 Tax=Pseudoduganella buxea TaxID=1949069 RepID=A0A6I3SU85_9BURK|nr:hypothetical protein [Pseudoduganella buxea]MTV52246.1 hypothetical protein [Pseudoduganella buxea]GGB86961.1 hypothetical protein GCM10011572_06200 [Pseudoduganella buxea]
MPALKKWEVAAVLAILATALLTPAGIYMAFKRWEADHYRALIASEVELAGVLSVEGESHFREGWGVAVFALAPAARDRFEAPGGTGLLAGREELRTASPATA